MTYVKKQPMIQSINSYSMQLPKVSQTTATIYIPDPCQHYWNVREHLTVDDGLIIYKYRLLIPGTSQPS